MPHAALWVVQRGKTERTLLRNTCFNAARGFVGGAAGKRIASDTPNSEFQCRTRLCGWCSDVEWRFADNVIEFQCRTRLCGWCNGTVAEKFFFNIRFNAARGFVGGAAE